MQPVARDVYMLGNDRVHFYVIADGGRFTLVDHGNPGMWDELPRLLSTLGTDLDAVEAVLLTHGHPDHVGDAERTRSTTGAGVHVHRDDEPAVLGHEHLGPDAGIVRYLWRPKVLGYLLAGLREGVLRPPPVAETSTFDDGEVVDVPGRPRVVHVPGHTAGSCALHVPDRDVLFAGDALMTSDRFSGVAGPQLPPDPVQSDPEQALASLDRLEDLDVDTVLVGHGDPWHRGVGEAVRLARRRGRR